MDQGLCNLRNVKFFALYEGRECEMSRSLFDSASLEFGFGARCGQ